jgi:hypothetical protein
LLVDLPIGLDKYLAKLRLKPTSGGAFSCIACPSRGGTGREGEAMLDTRYWIKQKGIPYYQVSRDQYPASRHILLPNVHTKPWPRPGMQELNFIALAILRLETD